MHHRVDRTPAWTVLDEFPYKESESYTLISKSRPDPYKDGPRRVSLQRIRTLYPYSNESTRSTHRRSSTETLSKNPDDTPTYRRTDRTFTQTPPVGCPGKEVELCTRTSPDLSDPPVPMVPTHVPTNSPGAILTCQRTDQTPQRHPPPGVLRKPGPCTGISTSRLDTRIDGFPDKESRPYIHVPTNRPSPHTGGPRRTSRQSTDHTSTRRRTGRIPYRCSSPTTPTSPSPVPDNRRTDKTTIRVVPTGHPVKEYEKIPRILIIRPVPI